MRFTVIYQQPKKKGYSKQEAIFFKVEDASMWEKHVLKQGATDVKIVVC
jgi:hypothetical protein